MLASVGSGLRGGLFPLVVIGRPRVSQNSSTFATVCITCVCFMASMMDVFQYPIAVCMGIENSSLGRIPLRWNSGENLPQGVFRHEDQ